MCYAWIATAAISAAGAYQQAQSQKAQATYQGQVAANNAQLAERQAVDAEERGNTAVQDLRRKAMLLEGSQRASFASRGIDISEGSANAMLHDTSLFADMDQNTLRANAVREAWGYRWRAKSFAGDAAAYGASADASNPSLMGSLAFGSVAARWYQQAGALKRENDWAGFGGTASDPWYG